MKYPIKEFKKNTTTRSVTRLLLVLMSSYILGLTLFSNGFLLTRLELDETHSCTSINNTIIKTKENENTCWHPKRYKKTILVIIDALRFDFTDYQPLMTSNVPHYINKLPIIHEILSKNTFQKSVDPSKETSNGQKGHGLLFRARADPPTTTLQRLKAITTGNLPTFVDAGSNFASTRINEDNLISQFIKYNKRVMFMGDDTWMGLFPDSLNESYPYPSFDVWDLHTVDNGVVKHLFPALRNTSSWDLLIAHFLGVDHAGHRYGPEHPAMRDKLGQMNEILKELFDNVDSDTIVYVMGDHGMDPKGDHGGDSENELNAGLFVYSKTPLFEHDKTWDHVLESLKGMNYGTDEPLVMLDNHRTFPQIDIVPTLALLSGLPIPFGNLGTIIPELFYVQQGSMSPLENLIQVARINAHQIHNYITKYSQLRSWAADSLSLLESEFESAETAFHKPAISIEKYTNYIRYTRSALVSARRIWARFDVNLILMGCCTLLLTLGCLFIYTLYEYETSHLLKCMIAGIVGGVIGYFEPIRHLSPFGLQDLASSSWHEVVFLSVTFIQIVYIVSCVFSKNILALWILSRIFKSWDGNVGLALIIMYLVGPASDSFTIYEDSITLYLLQTFGFYNLLLCQSVKEIKWKDSIFFKSLFFMILTRISGYSTICREEQHPYCTPTFNYSPTSSVAGPNAVLLQGILILGVLFMIHKLLSKSKQGPIHGVGMFIILILGFLLVYAYWTLDTLEGHGIGDVYPWIHTCKIWIARLLFPLWSIISWIGLFSIYKKMQVGFGYFLFTSILLIHLLLVQKPMGGAMLLLGYIQLGLLLEILFLWRDQATIMDLSKRKSMPKDPSHLLFLYTVVLFLLAQRYFFATGHQRALSSIQYEVGFIGLENVNWITSPLMILFNTYGSHTLFLASVPLLYLWRRPTQTTKHTFELSLDKFRVFVTIIGIQVACITIATLFAGHFKRHLMVWRVFAPKFIFGSVEMIVGFVILVISNWIE